MGSVFSIRTCFRSVCRHPFLLGMVIFLIFLYKKFPFMFSLLVYASPVFVSTAALLGTLLSYGQPNIPVIHKDYELSNENMCFNSGVSRDGILVDEKDESFDNVERFSEIRRDVVEKSIEEENSTANNYSDAGRDDTLCNNNNAVMTKKISREFLIEKRGRSDAERKLPDTVFENNDNLSHMKEGNSERLRKHSSPIQKSHEKSLDQSENKSSEKVDSNSPRGSCRKREDEGEEDDDSDVSDSESDMSDMSESTSPDASMTDITPVLDEIHPLLNDDAPQTSHMSTEVSDAASDISSKSYSESSNELDTDMENHGEFEVTDVEEGIYTDKDDDVQSAVSWTDDDHKNVINLGSSDLERNQRLESLIASRSLSKSMKIMEEKNLIDLDGIDLPHNVPHISTARRNPFDHSNDPYLNLGMPGSAPSVLAKRRSPFELPYDPGEEKHDMMGDDFEHVVTLQPKEPFFRRTETFSAGTSLLGTSRHDYNSRPYFVLDRMSSEGPSYPLHRKPSELSESKASSEPETESLGSVEELEDKIPVEEDVSQEPVVRTIAEHPSEDIGHGSESSEDEDTFEPTEVEKKDAAPDEIKVNLGDVDDYQEKVSSLSETAVAATTHMGGDTSEANEVVSPDDSSSASLSEEHENVFNEKGEQLSGFKPTLESSDAESTSHSVDDTLHKEPVFDSSPRALEKRLSSSSIWSDQQVEIVETNSPPVSVKQTISATDNESDVNNQITSKDTPATETDEKLVSTHQKSSSENDILLQSDKELPVSDQSMDEGSPVKHKELQDSAKRSNASELQEVDKDIQQNSNPPKTSEAASMQSVISGTKTTLGLPDAEDNMPRVVGNSSEDVLQSKVNIPTDTKIISEKLKKTGSGAANSEEVPSRNAEVTSDMPVAESGTVRDSEPAYKEGEHTENRSGESEVSHQGQTSLEAEGMPEHHHEEAFEKAILPDSNIDDRKQSDS